MKATYEDGLAVGDIIQLEGETVAADLRDKYWIVRTLEPEVTLSWPYMDAGCTVLYVPREAGVSDRDHLAHCETIERHEKQANRALGLTLKARPRGVYSLSN